MVDRRKSRSIRLLATFAALGLCWPYSAMAAPREDPCGVAREYIRLIELKQYDRVGDLWAEDAVFNAPNGTIIRGKANIRAFYGRFLRTITPVNRIGSLTSDRKSNACVMEIETRVVKGSAGEWVPDAAGKFERTAIDLFRMNKSGKIQTMTVYLAPKPAG